MHAAPLELIVPGKKNPYSTLNKEDNRQYDRDVSGGLYLAIPGQSFLPEFPPYLFAGTSDPMYK